MISLDIYNLSYKNIEYCKIDILYMRQLSRFSFFCNWILKNMINSDPYLRKDELKRDIFENRQNVLKKRKKIKEEDNQIFEFLL